MISVVIPLFNKEITIGKTLKSVLMQDYEDVEIIVVNDGSSDNSVQVVKKHQDTRIKLIEQENGGPGKARNTGVSYSNGDWILFLDADDELAEGGLSHLLDVAERHPEANVIDGSFIIKSRKGEQAHIHREDRSVKNNFKALFYREILPRTGNTLFKNVLISKYLYNTNIRRYEDIELLMRLLKEAKVVTTSRPILYVNTEYASASLARQSISEDFIGHLDFRGKSFWERMCLFQLYLWERNHYPEETKKIYPYLHLRYDLLLLNKLLSFLHGK